MSIVVIGPGTVTISPTPDYGGAAEGVTTCTGFPTGDPVRCRFLYHDPATVTLTATPAAGFRLGDFTWTGIDACVSTSSTCTFDLTGPDVETTVQFQVIL